MAAATTGASAAEGALEDVAPSPVGPAPPPRTGFVTALSGKHGWYFLAGGHDGAEDLTDVWRYDLADDAWQQVDLPSGTLGTRLLAATYSWHRSQLVLLARGFQGQLVVWGLFGPGAGATRLAELPSDGTPIGYVASVSETGELLIAVNHATGSYRLVRLANARDNYVPFASVTGAVRPCASPATGRRPASRRTCRA